MTGSIELTLPRPHTGQQRVKDSTARYRVLLCGRRWGKTTFGIMQAVECALNVNLYSKGVVGWGAPHYKYLRPAFEEAARLLKPVATRINRQDHTIELITGGRIEFWTLDDKDAARGRHYDLFIIDEAGFVRDLLPIWNEALLPTLADRKGKALFLGTPKGRGEFFKLYTQASNTDDWEAFQCPSFDNPILDREDIENLKTTTPIDSWNQEWLAIPKDDAGNPFGLAAIDSCVHPLSNGETVVFGVDLARAVDYTVLIGLDANNRVSHYERFQKPWQETISHITKTIGTTPTLIDKTGVGDPVVEQIARTNPSVDGFHFTSQSKQQLMEALASAISANEIGFPNNEIRRELDIFEYEIRASGVRYSAPTGMHDDCVCALALANYHKKFNMVKRNKPFLYGTSSTVRRKQHSSMSSSEQALSR